MARGGNTCDFASSEAIPSPSLIPTAIFLTVAAIARLPSVDSVIDSALATGTPLASNVPSVRLRRAVSDLTISPRSNGAFGNLERLVHRGAVGHHVADQPVRQGFGGGDVAAGQQHVARDRVRDLTG